MGPLRSQDPLLSLKSCPLHVPAAPDQLGERGSQWYGSYTAPAAGREVSRQGWLIFLLGRKYTREADLIWASINHTDFYFFVCSSEEPANWKHLIKWVIPDMSYVPWEGHQFVSFGASPHCAVWRADSPHQWRIPLWDEGHLLTGAHE